MITSSTQKLMCINFLCAFIHVNYSTELINQHSPLVNGIYMQQDKHSSKFRYKSNAT